MIYHTHILLNAYIKNPPKQMKATKQWLKDLVESIGMKVTMGPMAHYVKKKGNRGITAIVGLETSHCSIHVWDEEYPAKLRFDLYTCGELNVKETLDKITKDFELDSGDYTLVNRERYNQVVTTSTLIGVHSEEDRPRTKLKGNGGCCR